MLLLPEAPTAAPARVPFVALLERFGDAVALRDPASGTALTYAELAARARDAALPAPTGRNLVLIGMASRVDVVVHYLAALDAGHVPLLAPASGTTLDALVGTYQPDVVIRPEGGDVVVEHRGPGGRHDLHRDLSLLLTTSGSTGSPRLVRLSAGNVQANAEQIAQYLDLGPGDVGITSLPLQYSYGLSVLHSHLLVGAEVVLTDLSVLTPCFQDLLREHRVTTLAGVPYTFELLEAADDDVLALPSLRAVTQAGGRMPPERVRAWAERGRRQGWDLVVMYGQTEATARIAYLPPHLAAEHPDTVGVPVPGGELDLVRVPDLGADELVYRGPNVMLGYAETPADLARGRDVTELRTGDLAERTPEGLVRLVGRRSRFVKVVGLRVDLGQVERMLADVGLSAIATGQDGALGVVVEGGHAHHAVVRRWLAAQIGLPVTAVQVRTVEALPRLANGKPDLQTAALVVADADGLEDDLTTGRCPHECPVQALAGAASVDPSPTASATSERAPGAVAGSRAPEPPPTADPLLSGLVTLYARLLGRDDVTPDSTFVGLGGDSLSYVEVAVRLEETLGTLPTGWHLATLRELAARATAAPADGADGRPGDRHAAADPSPQHRRAPGRRLETTVALRALAILLVVGTHGNLFFVPGGAHLLLAVAGFNLGRFQLRAPDPGARWRAVRRSATRIAVPSVLWISVVAALGAPYPPATALLLTNVLGPDRWGPAWHFWFLEAVLWLALVVGGLLSIPAVHRFDRRHDLAVPLAVLAVGLLFRYDVVVVANGPAIQTPQRLLWLFTLGWLASRATTTARRVLVTALALVLVPGFFASTPREAIVVGALALLVWVTSVPGHPWLNRVAGVLAASSLYVYLTHWVVYPHLEDRYPLLAVLASFGVGIVTWQVAERTAHLVRLRAAGRTRSGAAARSSATTPRS